MYINRVAGKAEGAGKWLWFLRKGKYGDFDGFNGYGLRSGGGGALL